MKISKKLVTTFLATLFLACSDLMGIEITMETKAAIASIVLGYLGGQSWIDKQ